LCARNWRAVLAYSDSLEVDPAKKPDWWQRTVQSRPAELGPSAITPAMPPLTNGVLVTHKLVERSV